MFNPEPVCDAVLQRRLELLLNPGSHEVSAEQRGTEQRGTEPGLAGTHKTYCLDLLEVSLTRECIARPGWTSKCPHSEEGGLFTLQGSNRPLAGPDIKFLFPSFARQNDLQQRRESSRGAAWDLVSVIDWLQRAGGEGGSNVGQQEVGSIASAADRPCEGRRSQPRIETCCSRAVCFLSSPGSGKSTLCAALVDRLLTSTGPEPPAAAAAAARAALKLGDDDVATISEDSVASPPANLPPPQQQQQVGSGVSTDAAGEEKQPAVIVAAHFLRYDDRRSLEPLSIIKNLAYQLALR